MLMKHFTLIRAKSQIFYSQGFSKTYFWKNSDSKDLQAKIQAFLIPQSFLESV